MRKILFVLLIFSAYLNATLTGSNFTQRDLQILEDLDINPSFITDYKLQEVYERLQNKTSLDHYIRKMEDASIFIPRIKEILREESIPDSFLYMAMAESNFTIDARSNARATGLWQFMYATGKRYGLNSNMYVDERMDLVKSTVAATKYLKALHKRFGKWYLAAIAYNCGEGRVVEALTRAILDLYVQKHPELKNSKKIKEYRKVVRDYQQRRVRFYSLRDVYREVQKYDIEPELEYLLREQKNLGRQYLPRESRRYIRKIISLGMINSKNFIKEYENSHLLNMGISKTIATVPVKGGLHLRNIAKVIDMSYSELLDLNKHIKQSIIPPSKNYYSINIPYDKLTLFNKNSSLIEDTKYAIHVVRRGDTLYGISRKYKVPLKLIKTHNHLKTSRLSIKQKIVLPIPSDMLGKVDFTTFSDRKIVKKYIVKNGDSLYSIAKKYKINVKKLMRDNKLKTTLLKIGDSIVIR
ncbi:LysM peptidoglycan-binding domain-containing protein [Campylobacterota bacterium DY0563]